MPSWSCNRPGAAFPMLRKIVIGLAGALILILISAVVLLAFLGSGKESALKKAETF